MKKAHAAAGWAMALAGVAFTGWAETLTIKGSNTFGQDLGPALLSEFQQRYPGLAVVLETQGSSSGISALLDGTTDIASSSRPLNEDEERVARSRGVRIANHVVGYYGIAVIVNEQVPVRAMTDRHVSDLFTGKIASWSELGGPDLPVHVYTPPSEDGTYLGFQELAMGRQPYTDAAQIRASYADILASVAADPAGVGFVDLRTAVNPGVRAIIINGVHPAPSAVVENLYPYARQVRLLTNRDLGSKPAMAFIRFVQSREGQRIVEQAGFVPRMAAPMDLGGIAP
jgi:phosphate transport system substrate-binding protein